MQIIENVKFIKKGSLIASFDIVCQISIHQHKFEDFLIRGCCYFEKGNSNWITFPSKEYEKDGQKKYFGHNALKDIKNQKDFFDLVKKELNSFLTSQSPENQSELPF